MAGEGKRGGSPLHIGLTGALAPVNIDSNIIKNIKDFNEAYS